MKRACYSSVVTAWVKRRMAGAANSTTGSIRSQENSQDWSQCRTKLPDATSGKLAIAAAIAQVKSRLNKSIDKVAVAARDSEHATLDKDCSL